MSALTILNSISPFLWSLSKSKLKNVKLPNSRTIYLANSVTSTEDMIVWMHSHEPNGRMICLDKYTTRGPKHQWNKQMTNRLAADFRYSKATKYLADARHFSSSDFRYWAKNKYISTVNNINIIKRNFYQWSITLIL